MIKLILLLVAIGFGFYYGVFHITPDKKLSINTTKAKEVASKGVETVKEHVVVTSSPTQKK